MGALAHIGKALYLHIHVVGTYVVVFEYETGTIIE